jgi:hypothetical protein
LFGPDVRLRFTFVLRAKVVKRLLRGPSVVIVGVAAAPMVPVPPRCVALCGSKMRAAAIRCAPRSRAAVVVTAATAGATADQARSLPYNAAGSRKGRTGKDRGSRPGGARSNPIR